MRHDTIYGALQVEIAAFKAAAPAQTEAVRRLLAPAEEALLTCNKVDMWNAFIDLRKLRITGVGVTIRN